MGKVQVINVMIVLCETVVFEFDCEGLVEHKYECEFEMDLIEVV